MNRILYIFILSLCLCFGACRTNNGDIGPLYGEWALRSIVVDGEAAEIDYSLYFIRFQNNIVCVTELYAFNDAYNAFGTWTLEDKSLQMDFRHTAGDKPLAVLPPELLLPNDTIIDFEVNTITSTQLKLTYTDPEGTNITYTFDKLR